MLTWFLGFAAVEAALAYLQKQTDVKPLIGIICGSGLGGLADMIENAVSVDYKNIPHFPISTGLLSKCPLSPRGSHSALVPGHAGKLVFGTLGGTPVVAMKVFIRILSLNRFVKVLKGSPARV